MGLAIIILLITLIFFLAALCFRKAIKLKLARSAVRGLMVFNILLLLLAGIFGFATTRLNAQTAPNNNPPQNSGTQPGGQVQSTGSNINLAAALAVGLASIGAGIAVGITGSAAIGGITQNPGVFGRSLVFVGLAEGIAIYGLIIAFLILTRAFGG